MFTIHSVWKIQNETRPMSTAAAPAPRFTTKDWSREGEFHAHVSSQAQVSTDNHTLPDRLRARRGVPDDQPPVGAFSISRTSSTSAISVMPSW